MVLKFVPRNSELVAFFTQTELDCLVPDPKYACCISKQSMFETCLRAKEKNAAGTSLTVACTDTLVTPAKGWLCWDDERAVQEFSNGYIV